MKCRNSWDRCLVEVLISGDIISSHATLPPMSGSSGSLVGKDRIEVCPLSRGVILPELRNSYPPHYKAAFPFSILLCPHSHRLASRLAFPVREKYGFTTFHNSNLTG
jgi:hypothetical protein